MSKTTHQKKIFQIAFVGLQEYDQRILKSLFKLSANRDHAYIETELSVDNPPDIVILGGDANTVLANIKKLPYNPKNQSKAPVIHLSKEKQIHTDYYHLGYPLRLSNVFAILDEISIKELDYIPELTIGGDTASNIALDKIADKTQPTTNDHHIPDKLALVVDDSPTIRKQIITGLKLLGLNVDEAESGEKALLMVERKPYNIIFLDVVMPGIDGYKVCKLVKKLPATRDTPIIMLTGKSSPFDRVKGKLAGCDSYLTKPVEREAFISTVNQFLVMPTKKISTKEYSW